MQQEWSLLPQIGQDVIQRIAAWEVADLASVPKGGSQAMQREILAELSELLRQRPDLGDLVVRGVEAGLRPADSYVRDMASTEVQAFWDSMVPFLKASMIRFVIILLQTIEQATTDGKDCQHAGG